MEIFDERGRKERKCLKNSNPWKREEKKIFREKLSSLEKEIVLQGSNDPHIDHLFSHERRNNVSLLLFLFVGAFPPIGGPSFLRGAVSLGSHISRRDEETERRKSGRPIHQNCVSVAISTLPTAQHRVPLLATTPPGSWALHAPGLPPYFPRLLCSRGKNSPLRGRPPPPPPSSLLPSSCGLRCKRYDVIYRRHL